MKRLLLAAFAVGLIGCAEQGAAPPAVTTGYTYSRYSTSAEVWGYRSPIYRDWTTAQLQKRRLELYGMTPLAQSREGYLPISITGKLSLRKMRARQSKLS